MSEFVLNIQDLSLSFDGVSKVVENVSLAIRPGEIHGIIGESGSGKSLTALSVVQLQPDQCQVVQGSIDLSTETGIRNVVGMSERELRNIRGVEVGFVFQDPMTSLNPSMRCGQQVVEMIRAHRKVSSLVAKKEVMDLFEKVRLPEPERIFKSYPHEISGGQRQRVVIAIAMACKPRLLIADEPTTALDVTVQKRLIRLIDDLRKSEGMAVLFISHDLHVIADIADNVSIMYKGQIVETGSVRTIFDHPSHPYTKGLLACRPPMNRRIDRLPTVEEYLSGRTFEPKTVSDSWELNNHQVLIDVTGLQVFYQGKAGFFGGKPKEIHALKDIGFQVFEGESLAILGESGSGKSTLGKTMLNLLEARSGQITYRQKSILGMKEREFRRLRKKIQFVFQDPYASLNPKLTVGQTISEVVKVHHPGMNKNQIGDRVKELLSMVGLKESDREKYPNSFSGGQRQRIVIARALATEPECIICDEAVSALDVSVQAQILNLLNDLKSKLGLTYLFITHDLGVVRFFCDRVLVIEKGVLVESGKTADIFEHPQHSFTKELLGMAD